MTDNSKHEDIASGGCLCGNVRYEFAKSAVLSAGHCHCTDCQKCTGSGKATIVFLPTEALTINQDYKTYTVTGTDGSSVTRGFCPNCGSPVISYVEEVPETKFIKAGSLDDPSWVRAEASYWQKSAQPWSPVEASLPTFEGNPT